MQPRPTDFRNKELWVVDQPQMRVRTIRHAMGQEKSTAHTRGAMVAGRKTMLSRLLLTCRYASRCVEDDVESRTLRAGARKAQMRVLRASRKMW